jgi:phage head maturation protease
VIAGKQRAAQQGDGAVERAAASLLDQLDKPKSAVGRFEYKFTDVSGDPAGTFEGYGAVFNNEDDGGDMLMPGCCASTLAQHKAGTMPKMLLNHGSMGGSMFGGNDPMADVPIGKWTDGGGRPRPAGQGPADRPRHRARQAHHGAMKENELNGLSIGYRAKDFVRGTKPNEPRRTIKAIDLVEVSPVTFPMNAWRHRRGQGGAIRHHS